MAGIVLPESLSGRAERLTGAGTCPDGAVVGPSCELEGVVPSSDSGEEVCPFVRPDVIWHDLVDAASIDIAWRDEAGIDKAF